MPASDLSAADAAALGETAEAEAYADIYAAASLDVRRQLGLQIERIAGATLIIATGLPVILFNRVLGIGMSEPFGGKELDACLALFKKAGAGLFAIQLTPGRESPQLVRLMAERGLKPTDRWSKVYR